VNVLPHLVCGLLAAGGRRVLTPRAWRTSNCALAVWLRGRGTGGGRELDGLALSGTWWRVWLCSRGSLEQAWDAGEMVAGREEYVLQRTRLFLFAGHMLRTDTAAGWLETYCLSVPA